QKTISGKIAKTVFEEMYRTGKRPEQIVKKKNLIQVTDETEIIRIIDQVLTDYAPQVESYRSGQEKVFGFLVGQVMKASRGKASPALVNQLLKERL
ncbi:MAG: Asp-tRNA(Asn)/Glu-tRNA(Gln) amidotransferase GatCAB subunit B, partial [Nitrospirae bacterium CG08_land_8_20_14_0_20_52_24]